MRSESMASWSPAFCVAGINRLVGKAGTRRIGVFNPKPERLAMVTGFEELARYGGIEWRVFEQELRHFLELCCRSLRWALF
jgi:hypothetical protein